MRLTKEISSEDVKGLMHPGFILWWIDAHIHRLLSALCTERYPDDMDDDSILVPVDVSGEEEGFPTSFEELVEKVAIKCLWIEKNTLVATVLICFGCSSATFICMKKTFFCNTPIWLYSLAGLHKRV